MRAFALPSFYDGRIRVNLRGRERDGVVESSDYLAVCDELEGVVRACVDPRTGQSVVETVERAPGDPRDLDSCDSDLVVVWRGCALAFDHPEHGLVGPVPYRRTGGHTGPFGFAYVSGPGIEPADHGVASSFDVAPTIVELLGERSEGISGSPLRLAARV
jgi:predicted AlkP superfamily phosphohydrolase/phosphomutase